METSKDKFYIPFIAIISVVIPIVVVILLIIPESRRGALGNIDVSSLPLFHEVLNGTTAVMLLLGYYFIRNKRIKVHRFCMLTAFVLSAVFLGSYVIYHYSIGHTPFGGEGLIRYFYFSILISHITLAVTIIPLALLAIYRALTDQIEKHRKIVKWTFTIWLYVATTGVLVYLLMIPYY